MKSNEKQNGVDLLPNDLAHPDLRATNQTPEIENPPGSPESQGAAPCSANNFSENLRGPWDGTSSYTEIYEYEPLPESPKKGDLLDGFVNIVFDGDKCSYTKSVGGVIAL